VKFPTIPDIAAKQSIDAIRVFREFVRVRRELNALEGSLFWKQVGDYVYLVHKVKGSISYKGVRSAETERQLEEFKEKKSRLKERYKRLKDSVSTSERMNKAVRAGAVPPKIIDLLLLLEESGLNERSLVVGSPALYAYGQSSGVSLPSVHVEGQTGEMVPSHPEGVRLLIERPATSSCDVGVILKQALCRKAEVIEKSPPSSPWVDLLVHFGRTERGRGTAKSVSTKPGASMPHDSVRRKRSSVGKVNSSAGDSWAPSSIEDVSRWLSRVPTFEQVVVGKTGKMAVMRTFDPKVFVSVIRHARNAVAHSVTDGDIDLQLQFVETMIGESLVSSKLDESSREALESDLHVWLETLEKPSGLSERGICKGIRPRKVQSSAGPDIDATNSLETGPPARPHHLVS